MDNLQEQTQPVETGLAEAFQVATQVATQEASVETLQPKQEVSAKATEAKDGGTVLASSVAELTKAEDPSAPINLVMPSPPPVSEAARRNKELYDKLMARRNEPPAVRPLEPPIPRITEQTKREMAEGARVVAHHANQQAATIHLRKPNAGDIARHGTSVPVFRPTDYVPNMKQGDVQARNVG